MRQDQITRDSNHTEWLIAVKIQKMRITLLIKKKKILLSICNNITSYQNYYSMGMYKKNSYTEGYPPLYLLKTAI